jgi:hypothetical protein
MPHLDETKTKIVENRGRKPGAYSEDYQHFLKGRVELTNLRIAKIRGDLVPIAEVMAMNDEFYGQFYMLLDAEVQKSTRDPTIRRQLQTVIINARNNFADWLAQQEAARRENYTSFEDGEPGVPGRVGEEEQDVSRVGRSSRRKKSRANTLHDPVGSRYRIKRK